MVLKKYRAWSPAQGFLVPPSPHEWLPENDLAYFILDIVQELDLGGVEREVQRKDARGTQPYHPRMMLALLLYGYCIGVVSSRKLEQATYRDLGFRMLAAGQHPDHSVISEFRQRHLEFIRGLFLQTVRLCQHAGLVRLGRVALDGSKVEANASKHKAMSHERMLKKEAELSEEIDELLAQAEQVDREEDARFGRECRGDELPEELRRRQGRREKIRKARLALEAEAAQARGSELEDQAARQRAQAEIVTDPSERKRALTRAAKAKAQAAVLRGDDDDEPPPSSSGDEALPRHRVPATPEGAPKPKAQRNFTDPESRLMKQGQAYLQGYNGQAVVDEAAQVIVATGVTNQAPDQEHLEPLLERTKENCGSYPAEALADAGYWSESNAAYCDRRGIDAHIATGRLKHGEQAPPVRGPPARDLDSKGQMRRKLRTKKGKQVYARRKAIVEPVFGQMKQARGLRRFLLRGLHKVRAEWDLWCATHNLLKLYRSGWAPA